jgi:hypothetical protein
MLRIATFVLFAVVSIPPALGGPALTPPPPSFETCEPVGGGTICAGDRVESYGPVDTGIVCGSGASAFDIYDAGVDHNRGTRWYDRNGNLTRRMFTDHYTFGEFSNPLNGATVPYTQHNTTVGVLAVPGDLSTETQTSTGENMFTIPHLGAVFPNAGRTVIAPNGAEEFAAGPHSFDAYFGGDATAIRTLCSALEAP